MYQFNPSLIKPPRWNIQPHLTAAPELWDDAVVWRWLPGDEQKYIGVRTRQVDTKYNGFISERGEPSPRGVGFFANGNTWWSYQNDESIAPTQPFTIAKIFETRRSSTDDFQWIMSTTENNNNGYRLMLNNFGEGVRWRLVTSNGGVNADVPLTFNVGDILLIVARWDGSTISCDAYNLTKGTSNRTSQSLGGSLTHESDLVFCDVAPSGGLPSDANNFKGVFLTTLIANHAWSDVKRDKFLYDPFAMLRPGPQLLPLLFGGAGATGSTITDTAFITSATASTLTANGTATASNTAIIISAAASPLTATETAVSNDSAQITAVSTTPLTATATASATDTAQITNAASTPLTASTTTIATDTAQITSATVTTLAASETTSAAVTDTAVITSAAVTPLTAVESAIANDTSIITNAIVTTLVASENIGDLVSATITAQLTLPAPGSLTIMPQGALAHIAPSAGSQFVTPNTPGSTRILLAGALAQITPNAGSRLVTPNTPDSQSVTPDDPGSTTVTPRAD